MSNLPHIVRQRLAASSGADHPDADLLNAFAERRLAAPERDRVLAHLGTCADCREIVALATPEESATQPVFTPARSWWSIRSYQYGAVAATLAVVAVGLVLLRPDVRQENKVAQVPAASNAAPVAGYVDTQRDVRPKSPPPSLKKQLPDRTAEASGARGFASGKAFVVEKPTSEPPKELDKLTDASKDEFRLNREVPKRDRDTRYLNSLNEPPAAAGGVMAAQTPAAPPAPASLPSKTASAASTAPRAAQAGAAFGGLVAQRRDETAKNPAAPAAQSVEVTSEEQAVLARSAAEATPVNPPAQVATDPGPAAAKRRQKAEIMAATKDAEAEHQALMFDARYNARSVTWRINNGRLQKLDPSRNAYDDVAVGGVSRVSVVGALGTEVWVGGTDGTLYYSNDAGAHWIPVRTGAWPKDATFTGVTPTALRSVEVYLSNGERWRSADGGASWSKYQ